MEDPVAEGQQEEAFSPPPPPPEVKVSPKKFRKQQIRLFKANEAQVDQIKEHFSEALENILKTEQNVNDASGVYINRYREFMQEMHDDDCLSEDAQEQLVAENWKLLDALKDQMDDLRTVYMMVSEVHDLREEMGLNLDINRGQLMDMLGHGGRHLPLWMGDIGVLPPPRAGRYTSDEMPVVGELVAAFVKEMWIMAEVKVVDGLDKVTIRDVDDESIRYLRIYRHQILLLPKYRIDPKRSPYAIFEKSSVVLALYPQTTCFYKGIVESPPILADDSYLITFEDEDYEGGYAPAVNVPQRYVLNYSESPSHVLVEHVEASDSSESDEDTPEPEPNIPVYVYRRFKMRDSDEVTEPRPADDFEDGESSGEEAPLCDVDDDNEREESSVPDEDENIEMESESDDPCSSQPQALAAEHIASPGSERADDEDEFSEEMQFSPRPVEPASPVDSCFSQELSADSHAAPPAEGVYHAGSLEPELSTEDDEVPTCGDSE